MISAETEKEYIKMINLGMLTLADIKPSERTYDICLESVKYNGCFIEYVENQTDDICFAAIKNNYRAIDFIEKQTEEMCLYALGECGKDGGFVLTSVNEQTEAICLKAVKINGCLLKHTRIQNDEICLAAVKNNGLALQYVEKQTEEICMAAIDTNLFAISYVKNQTNKILDFCFKIQPVIAFSRADMSVYKYNKNDIENVFKYSDERGLKIEHLYDKIADLLVVAGDDAIVDFFKSSPGNIITENDLISSEKLYNLKVKFNMLTQVKADIINNVNIGGKNKII